MALEARFLLSVAWFMPMTQTSPMKDPDIGTDGVVLWTLLVIGLLPIIYAVLSHEVWGVWPSLGLLMVGVGIFGLVRLARERSRSRKDQ